MNSRNKDIEFSDFRIASIAFKEPGLKLETESVLKFFEIITKKCNFLTKYDFDKSKDYYKLSGYDIKGDENALVALNPTSLSLIIKDMELLKNWYNHVGLLFSAYYNHFKFNHIFINYIDNRYVIEWKTKYNHASILFEIFGSFFSSNNFFEEVESIGITTSVIGLLDSKERYLVVMDFASDASGDYSLLKIFPNERSLESRLSIAKIGNFIEGFNIQEVIAQLKSYTEKYIDKQLIIANKISEVICNRMKSNKE